MVTATSSTLVPQLLMVYSPRFNAQTIRAHVESLRDKEFVWWGRFSSDGARFDERAARTRWPHVAELADARAASGEASLLFVTNYVDLHVFKVSAVKFGDDARSSVRKEALGYYKDHSVPIWFRVTDVRGLSYDQTTTNEWFERRLGPVIRGAVRPNGAPHARTYDPTAAVQYHFPIVVDAPGAADLFERERPEAPAKRWADASDAISSRPVQRAREHLKAHLGTALWSRLLPETKDLLANGQVERGRMQHDADVDPAMGFTRIANAVEAELCGELMPELERLCLRLGSSQHSFYDALREELAGSCHRDLKGKSVPWSLGPGLDVLRRLATHHRRGVDRLGVPALMALCTNLRGIEELKRLRDPASHGGNAALWPALREAVMAFYAGSGEELLRIVEARDAVKGRTVVKKGKQPLGRDERLRADAHAHR